MVLEEIVFKNSHYKSTKTYGAKAFIAIDVDESQTKNKTSSLARYVSVGSYRQV